MAKVREDGRVRNNKDREEKRKLEYFGGFHRKRKERKKSELGGEGVVKLA